MAQGVNVQYVQYYTAGSAAKKLAPPVPVRTGVLPQAKPRQRVKIYLDPVALVGTLVAVTMLVMMLVGWSGLQAEQAKTAEMTTQVEVLRQENEALRTQYAEQCNLEEIRETALALGMVPKETVTHTLIQVSVPAE